MFVFCVSDVSAANGDTIFVNGSGGNDANNGFTWATAKHSIKNAAGSVNPNGIVTIANGTYTGADNTGITIDKSMTIQGQSQAGTIVNGTNTAQIFNILSGVNVTIQNLTLTNGKAPDGGNGESGSSGGAIYNNGNLTITNTTLSNNNAGNGGNGDSYSFLGGSGGSGGAIYNSGTLTVTNTTLTNNNAGNAGKGDIYGGSGGSGGAIYNSGTLTVTNTTLTNNNAGNAGNGYLYSGSGGSGGAIYNTGTGNFTVTGNTFTDNTTGNAGNSFFSGSNGSGGAIWNSGGDVTSRIVKFNRIIGNNASQGSAIYCDTGTVNATLNWWGSNSNPAGKISIGTGGSVLYDPWLVLTITASPGIIYTGAISQIKASITEDSGFLSDPTHSGLYYHDPASGHVPDGISVAFSTDKGTISSLMTTVHGIVQSTLNSGLVTGIADVSVKVDNETVNTSIKVLLDTTPPTVKVNYKTGFYNTSKSIILTTTDPDSKTTTYYTLDGSNPRTSSTRHVYTGPISITSTKKIEFSAVDPTGNWSPVYTAIYTIDKIPPKVISSYPKNYATGASRTATIYLKFSEKIKTSTYWSKIYIKNLKTGKIVGISKKWISGTILYLKTSTTRAAYNWYQVYIPAKAVKDYACNNLLATYTFKFKTGKY